MSIIRKEIADIREDYVKGSLSEEKVLATPIQQFDEWFQAALNSEVNEPTAMVLSTVDHSGSPSSRVVLLKDIREDGFSFFTNYSSRKSQEISNNAHVALLFFWSELQRQIRIEGVVEKLPDKDSDEYFASRPRGSRIGAIASPQSQVIPNRSVLEEKVMQIEEQLGTTEEIERPSFWGGYLVKPSRMEFWQGRASRLHDRIEYVKVNDSWKIQRLAP